MQRAARLPCRYCTRGVTPMAPIAVATFRHQIPDQPVQNAALDEAGIEKSRSPISSLPRTVHNRRGMMGVEVMGSEGYFLNQFLCAPPTTAPDRWAGTTRTGCALPVEVVKRVPPPLGVKPVGPDFIVIYRYLIELTFVPGGRALTRSCALPARIEAAGGEYPQHRDRLARGAGCRPLRPLCARRLGLGSRAS